MKKLGFGRYGNMHIQKVPLVYLCWVVSKAALRITRPQAVLMALEEIQRRPRDEAKREVQQSPQPLINAHMKEAPSDDVCDLV